jgi:hypothetical protein
MNAGGLVLAGALSLTERLPDRRATGAGLLTMVMASSAFTVRVRRLRAAILLFSHVNGGKIGSSFLPR